MPDEGARPAANTDDMVAQLRRELAAKEAEMAGLMAELENTNRGLIALHAELEGARDAEARVAAIVRFSDDAMYSLAPDMTVLTWNAGAEALLGYGEDEIVGKAVDVLIPDDVADDFENALRRVEGGQHAARYDTWRRHKDGTVVEVTVTLSRIHGPGGELIGFAAVLRDLTDRRVAEEELAVARASQEVFAERDRIAADLHDHVIQRLFASGMALQGALNVADLPEEASSRVERVIDDLDATIAEIRGTIFALGRRTRPGQALGLRTQVLELAARAAEILGFQPRLRFVGPVDAAVSKEIGDNLVSVVQEALSNAARHSGASYIEIVVHGGSDIVLEVSDNGRGFEPGGRRSGLDNMAARAERLGGTFVIESGKGDGTKLEWRVPANPTEI